jgi:microcompartment protein CcmK/EutM
MSSLSCKNVKIQDPTGTLVSTLSYDGTNITIDKPVLAPTAPTGTNNTQLATTAFAMGAGLGGTNQTWQDVTSSRTLSTTYTNSTGKPIMVAVRGAGSQAGDLVMFINGFILARQCVYSAGATQDGTVYGIIPNGSTYSVVLSIGSISYLAWCELR